MLPIKLQLTEGGGNGSDQLKKVPSSLYRF